MSEAPAGSGSTRTRTARLDEDILYPDGAGGGLSLFAFANVLLRHIRLVLLLPVAAFAGAAVLELSKSAVEYEAASSFMPQQSNPAFSMIGGLPWGGGGAEQAANRGSADFYMAVLQTRDLQKRAGADRFTFSRTPEAQDTVTLTLSEVYEGASASAILGRRVNVSADGRSGLITLRTIAKYPDLAEAINQRLLDLINDFNIRRAQTQAANEAVFIEGRMHEARSQLDAAESELQRFLEQNRNFESSPQLAFARTRLQRRVDLRQELYLSLARSYENARIEQMRNIPVIMVVEPPESIGQARTGRPLYAGIVALVAALIVAIALAYLIEFLRRQPSVDPEEFRRFQELRRTTLSRLTPRRQRSRETAAVKDNNGS